VAAFLRGFLHTHRLQVSSSQFRTVSPAESGSLARGGLNDATVSGLACQWHTSVQPGLVCKSVDFALNDKCQRAQF
jgi:hypothetical protein